MTNEEVLAQSRSENRGRDVADRAVQQKAATAAYLCSFALCALVSLLGYAFTRRVSAACWVVFFGMAATAFLVKFVALRKRHELLVCLCYAALCALCTVRYVCELRGL